MNDPRYQADVEDILRNVGVDVNCGACMEVAYCGSTNAAHTCTSMGEVERKAGTMDSEQEHELAKRIVGDASVSNASAPKKRGFGPHTVTTDIHNMGALTAEGWILLDHFEYDVLESEVDPNFGNHGCGSSYGRGGYGSSPSPPQARVLRRRAFLLVEHADPESHVADLQRQLSSCAQSLFDFGQKLREAQRATMEAKAEQAKVERALQEEQAKVEDHGRLWEKWSARHEETLAQCRRLEADLAKVRKAIGDIAYKEIVEQQP